MYINYNKNDFKTIYCLSNNNVNSLEKSSQIKQINDICDNILIYNKFGNNTTINIDYKNKSITDYSLNDISINFEIIKTPNIYNKYYGKILINNNYIALNTSITSNTYNLNNKISSFNINNIYLSFGNKICGLTQNNIFNNMYFDNDDLTRTKVKKIFFTKTNNFRNKPNIRKYNLDYLLNDNSYNDTETNVFRVIKQYPKDDATGLSNKISNVSLIDFFSSIGGDINNNIFYKAFNNYEITNNLIDYDYFDNNYNKNKVILKLNNDNSNLIKQTEGFRVVINDNIYLQNITSFTDISISLNYETNYKLNYDFRYNYDKESNSTILLTFTYSDSSIIINNLNFYKVELSNFYKTTEAGDFKDVACIFIYHNPESGGISYEYPNNNIQVITDVKIDNLSKAIELLPNANSATSNSIFIPAKNGSNLSKKEFKD